MCVVPSRQVLLSCSTTSPVRRVGSLLPTRSQTARLVRVGNKLPTLHGVKQWLDGADIRILEFWPLVVTDFGIVSVKRFYELYLLRIHFMIGCRS